MGFWAMGGRLALVACAALLGACATSGGAGPAPEARFSWFHCAGQDPAHLASAAAGAYRNPILQGFYPDPSITRAGDEFVLVHSTFTYFPGIPVFKSRDLVSWTQVGNAIDRPGMLDFRNGLGVSRGVFAPAITFHEGLLYLLNTCVDCGGNYLLTSRDAAGPWSDPVWLPSVTGIDPSLFFDDDGRAYIINNDAPIGPPEYSGHRALWMQEFDVATKTMIGDRRMVLDKGWNPAEKPIWIEGPHIFKHEGRYYLICAEGGTAEGHSQVVFRSDSVWGPWTPYPGNPILTQRHLDPNRPFPITSAGHADFVKLDDGTWWTIFLATRPFEGDFYNTGRETFLMPVTWRDGWPIVEGGMEAIPYTHARPNLPAQPSSNPPMSGNFSIREEFNGPALGPQWLMLRNPPASGKNWMCVEDGALVLEGRDQSIGGRVQPSFVAHRQQHMHATATTLVEFQPLGLGDEAGLAAFQDDERYYLISVAADGDGREVRVKRRASANDPQNGEILARVRLGGAFNAPIYLRIDARGGLYDFAYATRPGDWRTLLEGADGKILSTPSATGFVGTVFGLYAYSPK